MISMTIKLNQLFWFMIVIMMMMIKKNPKILNIDRCCQIIVYRKMPSKEILRRSRICIVPACRAVNSDFPDRIFFAVPESKRNNWLEIVGARRSSIKSNKRLYCCEKHFDVKKQLLSLISFCEMCFYVLLIYKGAKRH